MVFSSSHGVVTVAVSRSLARDPTIFGIGDSAPNFISISLASMRSSFGGWGKLLLLNDLVVRTLVFLTAIGIVTH